MNKSEIRKKILKIRKQKSLKNLKIDFKNILKILKKNKTSNKIIGGYYPYNYELDPMQILKDLEKLKFILSLPKIKKNTQMDFFRWSFNDPLKINKFGIPEPISQKVKFPDILLVPMVAFDKNLNRIGYGGGYYDRYITRLKKIKKIVTIGLAYTYQKVNNVPINKYDMKLDYIITEKSR